MNRFISKQHKEYNSAFFAVEDVLYQKLEVITPLRVPDLENGEHYDIDVLKPVNSMLRALDNLSRHYDDWKLHECKPVTYYQF